MNLFKALISVVDLAGPIAQCLEARRELWDGADLIAFEQQPDKRMLCVQAMLHMWFVCQGYKCKGVSAVHKLTNMIKNNIQMIWIIYIIIKIKFKMIIYSII